MQKFPDEIKITYIIAVLVMIIFLFFIILIIFLYNKKQLLYLKEKQLAASEYQNKLLQKELERQKSIQKERERISHDMHDDLGAGISALKLQAEYLKNKVKDQELQEDIADLLTTSEDMNVSMREMIWSLNEKNNTIGEFEDYIKTYGENFFRKSNIHFYFSTVNLKKELSINSEKRRNLFLCIKEALNNVYKHSQAQNIFLKMKLEDDFLIIDVEDDGIGLQNNGNGNGLKNMRERMNDICGEIVFQNKNDGLNIQFSSKL